MRISSSFQMIAILLATFVPADVLLGQSNGPVAISNITGPSSVIEGYGGATTGGAGGPIYHVTTLADSGPGSLRDAVLNRSGPRTVVFDVGGTITLLSDIPVQQPYLTIDGSTAPSPGITVQRASLAAGQFILCGTHDVILRHLRLSGLWQPGAPSMNGGGTLVIDGDSPPDRYAHHMVLDHLTCCNASDGGPDIWGNVSDVILSWSLMYFNIHPTSLSYYPAPYQPRRRISIHHNVYARNGERNPQIRADTSELDFVNNVIYDYDYADGNSGYGTRIRNVPGEPKVNCNIINNYFAPTVLPDVALVYGAGSGPDSEDGGPSTILPQGSVYTGSLLGSLYVSGNILPPQNLDQYSTVGSPLPTPAAAKVTTSAAAELKARVLPLVGVHYRSALEQAIMDDAGRLMSGPARFAGDLSGDGDIDADDVLLFRACQTRPGVSATPGCTVADLNGDAAVDQSDFGLLQRCFSGANKPVTNAGCLR